MAWDRFDRKRAIRESGIVMEYLKELGEKQNKEPVSGYERSFGSIPRLSMDQK